MKALKGLGEVTQNLGTLGANEASVVVPPKVDQKQASFGDPKIDKRLKVEVAGPELRGVDRTLGVHLKKVLGGLTLSDAAANPQHQAKMDQSAATIGHLERLPGNLRSLATFRSGEAFKLYEHSFPNPDEREPVADIKARLKDFAGGTREDGNGFHAVGIADQDRRVVGYTQGSTVPTEGGLFYYWQYGCVADQAYMEAQHGVKTNPREQGVLNTIHGVNAAILLAAAERLDRKPLGMVWESEPRGLGDDAASIQFTDLRLKIHNRAGGRVMMGVDADGNLVNLHLQPRLTPDSDPIALHMMFRPLKYRAGEEKERGELSKEDAAAMMLAWINNFTVEGFPKQDVDEATAEIQRRLDRSVKIVLLPPNEVPDVVTLAQSDGILRDQVLAMYQVDSLEQARAHYERAMTR